MSRETLTGLGRFLDHFSLGLAGLAALALSLLAEPRWLGVTLAAALLFAALALWWGRQRRARREFVAWRNAIDAQSRLSELLLPVWQGQIHMAGQHCAQATEALVGRLANVVLQVGRPLPHANCGACDGEYLQAWQAERSRVLAELSECTAQLQFQDRVDQILAHVRHNVGGCRETLLESCRHFETHGEPLPLDIERLLVLLEASYATQEEHVVHQAHLAVSEVPRHASTRADAAITYF